MLDGKTVLLGGSFNPPHVAHQMSCLYLLQCLGAKEVWLVPANSHPFGKELIDYEHRFAMCELLAAPLGTAVFVSDAERRLGGLGRTYDLIRHLQQTHLERSFALSVGADILAETDQWHRWQDICEMVDVVTIGRRGHVHQASEDVLWGGELELPEVSSSQVRARLAASKSINGLLPRSVADYIEKNGLYGA